MHVNFISYKDTGETRTIFVRSDNKEIRLGDEIGDIVKKLLESFNCQKEETMLRNGSVDLLSYNVHKISLKRGKSQKYSRMDIK